jgi:hypothetical protein
METLLNELIGKRVLLSAKGSEPTIAILIGVDEKTYKLKMDLKGQDPKVVPVGEGLITYINRESIDSVVDIDNDTTMNQFMAAMQDAINKKIAAIKSQKEAAANNLKMTPPTQG